MSENSPVDSVTQTSKPSKPRRRKAAPHRELGATTTNAADLPSTPVSAEKQLPRAASSKKTPKQWRSGYEVSPQPLSFTPYALERKARKRAKPFSFEDGPPAKQARPNTKISAEGWNKLAHEAGVLPASASLRDFQIQCAEHVLRRGKDICVIAPTGAGKSMLWCLPVLTCSSAISLVITPYTSLGDQGEFECVFLLSVYIHTSNSKHQHEPP